MTHLIDYLETGPDYDSIFGVIDNVYADKGFKSNGDNFLRCRIVEEAVAKFSDFTRVDKTGHDFIWTPPKTREIIRLEFKMAKQLFYKREPYKTKKFKVKSFLSDKKTIQDFQKESTFDYLMVWELFSRRIILVEDERARELYLPGSDGAVIQLNIGDYYECDIPKVNPVLFEQSFTKMIDDKIGEFLNSGSR
jgi:hypothetical protein